MKNSIGRFFEKKWVSAVSLLIVVAIMFCAYFFQQSLETYIAWGLFGLLVGCFLANATVLLPAPSILLVCQFALVYNPFITALIGSIGATSGEMVGYFAGSSGRRLVASKRNSKIMSAFQNHPYVIVFAFSILPLPFFDVIGIISGASKLKWYKFFAVCWLGKAIKMLIYSVLFVRVAGILPTSFDELTWDNIKSILPHL